MNRLNLAPLVLISLLLTSTVVLAENKAFPDVPANSTFSDAVNYSSSNSIVSGYPDGTFRPNNKINRAEFTKIIINSQYSEEEINECLTSVGEGVFPDVPNLSGLLHSFAKLKKRTLSPVIPTELLNLANQSLLLRPPKLLLKVLTTKLFPTNFGTNLT